MQALTIRSYPSWFDFSTQMTLLASALVPPVALLVVIVSALGH